MKRLTFFFCLTLTFCLVFANISIAASNARMPAIRIGADHLINLQRDDAGWEGTWFWYVGNAYNATNLTGTTALGILEAFKDTKDSAYLESAKQAASFCMTHLGIGATSPPPYHVRWTAPDVVFVHYLGQAIGDELYTQRATEEWENVTSTYPTAGDLDTLFRNINRPSTWDIAFFLEAAYLSGDTTWADEAAAIIANTGDTFYYTDATWWYALNLAGSIRALINCGYASQYQDQIIELLYKLIALCDSENGIDGYIQDTAYAIIALNAIGGPARSYANALGRWLASQQEEDGGWDEAGYEYPEIDGEAVRALASTIGTNFTVDGFEKGISIKASAWHRDIPNKAEPFMD